MSELDRIKAHPAFYPCIVLVLAAAWFITTTSFRLDGVLYGVLADDAWISMRYAQHLAAGEGLAWNIGEAPVEGFSNLGWVLVMAIPHLLGVPEHLMGIAMQLIGLAILLALTVLSSRLGRALSHFEESERISPWLVALSAPVFYWTLRGFEVGAGALVLMAAACLVVEEPLVSAAFAHDFVVLLRAKVELGGDGQRRRASDEALRKGLSDKEATDAEHRYLALSALMVVGVLLRDDFVVPLAVIAWFSSTRIGLWSMLASAMIAKVLFRLGYFGDLVPLTAYLKLSAPLLVRLSRGVVAMLHTLLLGVWLPLLGCWGLRSSRWGSRLPFAVLVSTLAYQVFAGGDAWEELGFADRFVAPVLPIALVGLAGFLSWVAQHLAVRWRAWVAVLIVVGAIADRLAPWRLIQSQGPSVGSLIACASGAIAFAGMLTSPRPWSHWVAISVSITSLLAWGRHLRLGALQFVDDRSHIVDGVTIRSSTTEAARVAVVQAGAVPYFSHRYIVDELGKNDVAIAKSQDRGDPWHPGHSKWDPAWSFGTLQPDLTEEVWFTRDFDVGNLPRWGYRPISAAMWVRENSHEVAVERIRELAAWEHSHDAERVEWARER